MGFPGSGSYFSTHDGLTDGSKRNARQLEMLNREGNANNREEAGDGGEHVTYR